MTKLAPLLQTFFTERLIRQRGASPHTVAAYRDTWRMLLTFAADRTGKQASQLDLGDIDAETIAAFLDHLQTVRGNSVIALWLGHVSVETTQIYLHADLAIKEQALDRTTPPAVQPGRYQPPDALLTWLEGL